MISSLLRCGTSSFGGGGVHPFPSAISFLLLRCRTSSLCSGERSFFNPPSTPKTPVELAKGNFLESVADRIAGEEQCVILAVATCFGDQIMADL